MKTIEFLNDCFWEDSAYFVLMVISIIGILMSGKENSRAKRMAWFTILALVLVIWNPLVASKADVFFGDDMRAYLRIFYLIPLMPLIAYAGTVFYVRSTENRNIKRKVSVMIIICITIIGCGGMYGASMYQSVDNIYKIDAEAIDISNLINEDSKNQRVTAIIPSKENFYYGIRQYTGNIVIVGTSDDIHKNKELSEVMNDIEFEYIVFSNDNEILYSTSLLGLEEIGLTENYTVFKRMEG